MSAIGLIVDICAYPRSEDLATALKPGNGPDFCKWLIERKGLDPANIYVCADGGVYPAGVRQYPTLRERIVDAVSDIIRSGQDQTEELFVFFSGHGYSFKDSGDKRPMDVLVAADYVNAGASGTACIQLADLQNKLYFILGGRNHYYFIDSCRTELNTDEIEPIALGRKFGRVAQRGTPTTYSMFSTAFGEPARINSEFAPALLDGLAGTGAAKAYTAQGDLYVMFPRLFSYVQSKQHGQKADKAEAGNSGDGLILKIAPIPSYTCNITVQGANATDAFTLNSWPVSSPQFRQSRPFIGPAFQMTYPPGDLSVEVTWNGWTLPRVSPPPAEMPNFFDNCDLEFEISDNHRTAPPPPPPPPLVRPKGPADATRLSFRALNLSSGIEKTFNSGVVDLEPGDYRISVMDRSRIFRQKDISIPAAETASINLWTDPGPVRRSIVQQVNPGADPHQVDFSESLQGPIIDPDLGLWLTLMAAGHIVAEPELFSKLSTLHLLDTSQIAPNTGCIYVLAGLQHHDRIAVDFGAGSGELAKVDGLQGVFHGTFYEPTPSLDLISLSIGDLAIRTQVIMTFPNRVTLLVISDDEDGRISINQMALPVSHLISSLQLPPDLKRHLQPQNVLRTVKALYHFGSEFSHRKNLTPVGDEEQQIWMELLNAKWVDPIMTLLPCYEAIRRGDDGARHIIQTEVIPNMEAFFPNIPDVAAIATMLGMDRPLPALPPLITDGLLAWDNQTSVSPSTGRLDPNSPWTSWFGRREDIPWRTKKL